MTDAQIKADVEAWLADNWTGELPPATEQFGRDPRSAWLAKVRDAGYATPRWPADWYGRDYTNDQAKIVERAFAAAGAPGAGQDRTNLWANTAFAHATPAFKHEIVPKLLAGEVGMCLLYSEPGAGSDLAAIRTRAERDGDDYVINGQKVWTSGAASADYGMLIARTDWDVPKHRGISFFFLPMKQAGVEVRPLRQVTDEAHFNEVFITDARVPAANVLGPLNGGWSVLQTALAYERSVMGDAARGPRSGAGGPKGDLSLLGLAKEAGKLGDPLIRQDVARVIGYRMLNKLNTQRAKAEMAQGTSSPIMSLGKLAMSRILHEEARVRTALLGPESLLEGPDHPRAEDANFLTFNAYFTSIGGGTDQIQRNIIGERVLGLPKEPEVDRTIPFREVRAG
ncbi:acyl-CoA dehydrogenase family protein [Sphingomonas sp. SUN019]|uniref:acyl-CoA dehydrogenase family protein n=1 Tax=Sphingomonas sp. SUN019 TaxID=2937788 RepID=UPI00216477CF|nr:acyl-CoA dehydrogenase family protein [Sphingomonas sp. SUN019]UVO49988.1 acyl-CoA dehydrogenase family protein [Sphingomonas sp. SUN019]